MNKNAPVRPRLQINASTAVVNRAKAVAYSKGMSLTELVMQLLAGEDEELARLIKDDLSKRTRPGNPAKV